MKFNLSLFIALLSFNFPNSQVGVFSEAPEKIGLSVVTQTGLKFDCVFHPEERNLLSVEIVKPSETPVEDIAKVNEFLGELLLNDSLYYKDARKPCDCGTHKLIQPDKEAIEKLKRLNVKPKRKTDGIKRA